MKRTAAHAAKPLTIALAATYGAWALGHGLQTGMDTQTYSKWADVMIAHHFNVAAYLRDQTFVAPPLFYLMWVLVVAALKVTLGGWWMQGIVALNWVCFTAGAYATLSFIERVTASVGAVVLGAGLFVAAADLLIFVPFVLSDLAYWGVSTGIVVTGLSLATTTDDRRRGLKLSIGSALTLLAFMIRPVAPPLAIFWIIAVIASTRRGRVAGAAPALLAAVCVLAAIAMLTQSYVLMEPSVWPGRLPAVLELLAREFREGILVYAPGGTNVLVTPATGYAGFLRITIEKWLYFCTPWLPHYSLAHALINAAFFAPIYVLGASAWLLRRRLLPAQQIAVFLLLSLVVLMSAFHAMTMIDYDHRYRLPLLPVLIVLAACGLEAVRRPPLIYDR